MDFKMVGTWVKYEWNGSNMVEIWMVYMQNMGGMQKYGKSGKFGETDTEKNHYYSFRYAS